MSHPAPKMFWITIPPKCVKVALVSFPLSADDLKKAVTPSIKLKKTTVLKEVPIIARESDEYCFFNIEDKDLETVKEGYLYAINTAVNKGANMICFGEMSYPYSDTNKDINAQFKEEIKNLAAKKTYILLLDPFTIL